MWNGFGIGLLPTAACRSSRKNCLSALQHSQVVSEFLQRQVAAGYMMGPFDLTQCSGVITSSLGVVPKSTSDKFRVIVDLSSPTELSVNNQTHRELAQVAHSSIEDAALLMHALGPGTRLKLTSRRLIVGFQYTPSRGPSWQCYEMVAYTLIASSHLALHQHPQSLVQW